MNRELQLAEKVMLQSRGKVESKDRMYSLHAPEVECIAKGKAGKKFEFGCKVALAATLAARAASNHPASEMAACRSCGKYDGRILTGTVNQVERMTGSRPYLCGVDTCRESGESPLQVAASSAGHENFDCRNAETGR